MAEWLGRGLQNLAQRFESARDLSESISFHCARHTFATIGIEIRMRLDIISKILGHTDLKTTQIYFKYSIAVKRKEMEKWK